MDANKALDIFSKGLDVYRDQSRASQAAKQPSAQPAPVVTYPPIVQPVPSMYPRVSEVLHQPGQVCRDSTKSEEGLPIHGDIERMTLQNSAYRRVIATVGGQLTVNCLRPGEDIPWETHHGVMQFIRLEQGSLFVYIDNTSFRIDNAGFVLIPPGRRHRLMNPLDARVDAKFYSVYSTATHPVTSGGHVDATRAAALARNNH